MTSAVGTAEKKHAKLPLNDDLYTPDEEAKAFYREETGISADEDLKKHICAVQHKAYSVRNSETSVTSSSLPLSRFISIPAYAYSSL